MPLHNIKRQDLAVQYKHVTPVLDAYAKSQGITGLINQSMPMAAMFMRNKYLAWFATIQSFHQYLTNDKPEDFSKFSSSSQDQPPTVRLILSLVSLVVCYIDLVFPAKQVPPPVAE